MFHHKKHHPDLPYWYNPEKIQCQKCFEAVNINSIFFHNSTCGGRSKKNILLTITEEKSTEKSSCQFCNRKFLNSRISKHQSACEYASKKRPIFDILKKRIPYLEDIKSKIKLKKPDLNLKYPNSKWQKQHLQLLKNLRVESEESFYEDFISCPHCYRRFAPVSAEKHIHICKNILNKPKPPPSILPIRLPDMQNKVKPLTVSSGSLKHLGRPDSVMPISGEGFRVSVGSVDDSYSNEFSPDRSKDVSTSIRETKSIPGKRMLKRRHISKEKLKQLKPSHTVKEIGKEKQPILNNPQRAHSTQRIHNSVACRSCGAPIPGFAKFCSMCGVIRMPIRNLS